MALFAPATLDIIMLVLTDKDSTTLPVSVADMRDHLRVDHTSDDDYIEGLILSATRFVEAETGRDFTDATYDAYVPEFPGLDAPIQLTKQPCSEVVHIKYYATDGTQQTWDSDNYHVMKPTNVAAWIAPIYTTSYPASYTRPDAVNVKYVVSYSAVPKTLEHCLKLIVGSWYEHRESNTEAKISELPLGAERLMNQLKVICA